MDLRDLLVSPDWHNQAACRGLPVSMFYSHTHHYAASVCRRCPVVTECLRECLDEESRLPVTDVFGFRAGLPATTRKRLRGLGQAAA